MELLQLEYFCNVAETGSFAKSATKYKTTAQSISQCIRRLEREMEVCLFDRYSNKIELNEKGKIFYEKTKKALNVIKDARKEITSL